MSTDRLTLRDGEWTTWQGESTRTTAVFSDDGRTQTARRERSDDGGNWVPSMHVAFTKVD